jgi:hypothetical protein
MMTSGASVEQQQLKSVRRSPDNVFGTGRHMALWPHPPAPYGAQGGYVGRDPFGEPIGGCCAMSMEAMDGAGGETIFAMSEEGKTPTPAEVDGF